MEQMQKEWGDTVSLWGQTEAPRGVADSERLFPPNLIYSVRYGYILYERVTGVILWVFDSKDENP
jgi:hypothetical protein